LRISLLVGVWWHVGNTKLLKRKKHKTFEFVDKEIIIYALNHSGVFWRSSTFAGRCFSRYDEFLVVRGYQLCGIL